MQKRFNILYPLTCPRCQAELLTTLDQIQREESARCAACGTTVELRDEVPVAPAEVPSPQDYLVL